MTAPSKAAMRVAREFLARMRAEALGIPLNLEHDESHVIHSSRHHHRPRVRPAGDCLPSRIREAWSCILGGTPTRLRAPGGRRPSVRLLPMPHTGARRVSVCRVRQTTEGGLEMPSHTFALGDIVQVCACAIYDRPHSPRDTSQHCRVEHVGSSTLLVRGLGVDDMDNSLVCIPTDSATIYKSAQ